MIGQKIGAEPEMIKAERIMKRKRRMSESDSDGERIPYDQMNEEQKRHYDV